MCAVFSHSLCSHTHRRRVTALALIQEHTRHRLGFQCSVLTVKQPARPASYNVCFTTLSLIFFKPGNLGWWAFYSKWPHHHGFAVSRVPSFPTEVLRPCESESKYGCISNCVASLSCLLSLSLTPENNGVLWFGSHSTEKQQQQQKST